MSKHRRRILGPALAAASMVGLYALTGCSAEESSHTLFGATLSARQGESTDETAARLEREIGRPAIARLYFPAAPASWPEIEGRATDAAVVVSFKVDPGEVLGGEADGELMRWFRAAPRDRAVYWTYFHEPEDNVESGQFTAGEFVAAWRHIESLAAAVDNPRLHSTLVLMCWTLDERSGRSWQDYVPSGQPPEVLAWDCYSREAEAGRYTTPDRMFGSSVRVSESVGAQWAVAELGAELANGDDGQDRAQWLSDVAAYARAHDAAFVTYFHALQDGAYELSDSASQAAWRHIMSG